MPYLKRPAYEAARGPREISPVTAIKEAFEFGRRIRRLHSYGSGPHQRTEDYLEGFPFQLLFGKYARTRNPRIIT